MADILIKNGTVITMIRVVGLREWMIAWSHPLLSWYADQLVEEYDFNVFDLQI